MASVEVVHRPRRGRVRSRPAVQASYDAERAQGLSRLRARASKFLGDLSDGTTPNCIASTATAPGSCGTCFLRGSSKVRRGTRMPAGPRIPQRTSRRTDAVDHLPRRLERKMQIALIVSVLPVAGIPSSSALCVPCTKNLTTTRSLTAKISVSLMRPCREWRSSSSSPWRHLIVSRHGRRGVRGEVVLERPARRASGTRPRCPCRVQPSAS